MNDNSAAAAGAGGIALLLLIISMIVGAAIYFIPSVLAVLRKHKDTPAIIAVNLIFGWTFFGWFLPLIWSLSDPRGRNAAQTVVIHNTAASSIPAAPSLSQIVQPQAVEPPDVRFWDQSANKSDPDFLEEYLVRYPGGQFAALARSRLARTDVSAASSLSTEPIPVQSFDHDASRPATLALPVPANDCTSCGSTLASDASFCEDCGVEVQKPA